MKMYSFSLKKNKLNTKWQDIDKFIGRAKNHREHGVGAADFFASKMAAKRVTAQAMTNASLGGG